MRISVFGTGYVGLVTGVCFAEMGNDVICVDVDRKKIALLQDGRSPIYEPGLDALIASNLKAQRIQFVTEPEIAVQASDLLFVTVGTPNDEDGSADLKSVIEVVNQIAKSMSSAKTIVVKSTVPVGSCAQMKDGLSRLLKERGVDFGFQLVFNPEFLREGHAVEDCLKPARVVVGCDESSEAAVMEALYEPFLKSGNPFLVMDLESAEMTKYAANSMLAAKISLMNELSRVCEKVGADIESVRRGMATDPRIGPHFIFAGVGYGGSCFPKDIRALIQAGMQNEESLEILKAVEKTNQRQKENFFRKICRHCDPPVNGSTVTLWGVSFKPGTDDIRFAPSLDLIHWLLEAGWNVSIFDPVASENARNYFHSEERLKFHEDQYEALRGAEALLIVTEWKSFKEPNFQKMKSLLKRPLIFDGRNLFSLKKMTAENFEYHSIGRPSVGRV